MGNGHLNVSHSVSYTVNAQPVVLSTTALCLLDILQLSLCVIANTECMPTRALMAWALVAPISHA